MVAWNFSQLLLIKCSHSVMLPTNLTFALMFASIKHLNSILLVIYIVSTKLLKIDYLLRFYEFVINR